MLDYAVKLTLKPGAMERADVDRLRDAGWSDEAILDVVQITAHFAFANRLADGLGVELEAFWASGAPAAQPRRTRRRPPP